MITLYNTDKELFFSDYKPISDIVKGLSCTDLLSLLENLENAINNACANNSPLLETALYSDIAALKKHIIILCIKSYGSGTIAGFICNTKYSEIDKAVNKTLYYLYHAETEELYTLETDMESIKNLIIHCYKTKDTYSL